MFQISNLFVGETKELKKVKEKLNNVLPGHYSDIFEQPIPHFYAVESCEDIKPQKWMQLLTGCTVGYYWSAADTESEVFLRTECDEIRDLLPTYFVIVDFVDGVRSVEDRLYYVHTQEELLKIFSASLDTQFTTLDELLAYTGNGVKNIRVGKYENCDLFGNKLNTGDEITLMYEYINVDAFIKWLNFKLRNDGVYEVTEKNVKPFLKDIEVQMHSRKGISSYFVLPCYSTRSGEYEAYKYEFRFVNGKETVCL